MLIVSVKLEQQSQSFFLSYLLFFQTVSLPFLMYILVWTTDLGSNPVSATQTVEEPPLEYLNVHHRRRIETEGKAKVVASVWGAEFVKFFAALAVLCRSF